MTGRLSLGDRLTVILMVGVPLTFVVGLVWLPTFLSAVLSFTSWDGIGGVSQIQWVGTRNYQQIVEIYPPF
jgi:multiple sugar transport system permease protein